MSEVGRRRMTSRILADIVQCHVHFFHLTVSIQVAFFLAHKQAWGPTCLWSRAAEASGWAATSHTVSCRRWRRPWSSAARHQSNQTAPGCFMFFVQHVPWQFFNPGYKSQQMVRILVWEVACRHLWCCLNLSHTYFRHLEDIAVMLSVAFTSSGPLQDARSRTSGAAQRTRSGVGSLQFWCP